MKASSWALLVPGIDAVARAASPTRPGSSGKMARDRFTGDGRSIISELSATAWKYIVYPRSPSSNDRKRVIGALNN
jgi:hypothetical protein